jgi:hypothetical protein
MKRNITSNQDCLTPVGFNKEDIISKQKKLEIIFHQAKA